MKIRTIPSIFGRIAAFYQGRILLSLPFLVFCWFLVLLFCFGFWFCSMSSNLSYSDGDSQLDTQSPEPQDVGISVNSGISIFCHKRQSVIQHVILDSYYVPGTVVRDEKFETYVL